MNSRSETLTMNGINRKKSRPNAPRGGRGLRGSGLEKPSYQPEGVYTNPRLTHAASSIVGCVVLVELKNGDQYEGVLRTVSSKMDVVLDMAHQVDESFPQNSVPTKDRLIETMIFQPTDIVSISALNVDLEYAIKDTFSDSAISAKYNGQAGEKELQPWDAEAPGDGSLEAIDSPCGMAADNSNGWDPNEMFKTNAERFDVKSSYDPSLSQYTTPLKQENTDEYKKREAHAAKLAHEIEKSDSYKARIALEIGDGDEEEKFSSVVRPGDQGGAPGKYVPPHLRKNPQQGRATRTAPQGIPGSGRSSVSSISSPQPSPTQHAAPVELDTNVNGEKDEAEEVMGGLVAESDSSGATVEKEQTPPIVVSKSVDRKLPTTTTVRDEQIVKELKQFSTDFKLSQSEEKKRVVSPAQGPHAALASPTTPSSAESVSSITPQRTSPVTPNAAPSTPPVSSDEKAEKKEEDKYSETLKKSNLNPNAKEFVFNPNAKPFQPKQPPVATPPRPAAQQSPVMVQHMPPVQGPLYPSYQVVPVSVNMTPNVVQQTQQPRFDHRKRAVVSVQPRPDFQAQAAAAAAATGQPLLAQPTGIQQTPQYVQYMPPGMGQPGSIPQMVPMPPTTMPQRVMAPPVAGQQHLEQGMQQGPGGQNAIFVSPPGPGAAVQAAGAAAAAHLGPPPGGAGQPHSHPAPAHMAPHHQHTPPHSQASQHMNSQGGGGGHAAPSPVQHPVTPGHPPPPQQGNQQLHSHPGAGQAHPATSGTPQPHVIYQHPVPMSQQGGHPPMQPSPHTPTSPQTMYPQTFVASPFFQTSQAPGSGMPQQQQNPQQQPPGGAPQLSFTHTQPHTTASHAHHQHSHMPGHQGSGAAAQAPAQIVMMPHNPHPPHQQVPAPGQLQHPGQHLQHAHQIPHQMAGMQAGQASHMIQQQAMGVPSANNMPHAQMHYPMHHHQMQQPGPGQGYQHQ